MRGIPAQLGATGKPGCGKPAGRPRRLALCASLAVTAPTVLALALAGPAIAAEHHGHLDTPVVPSSPAGPVTRVLDTGRIPGGAGRTAAIVDLRQAQSV
jgi:hypothetical protein